MLEAIGAGVTPRVGNRDWKDIWMDSPEYKRVKEELGEIKREALSRPQAASTLSSTCKLGRYDMLCLNLISFKDATPFWYQLKTVVQRNNMAIWRSPDYVFSRLFVASLISFFISLSFLQLGNSIRELQFRVFGMYVLLKNKLRLTGTHEDICSFWVVVLPALVMSQIEPVFIMNRRAPKYCPITIYIH